MTIFYHHLPSTVTYKVPWPLSRMLYYLITIPTFDINVQFWWQCGHIESKLSCALTYMSRTILSWRVLPHSLIGRLRVECIETSSPLLSYMDTSKWQLQLCGDIVLGICYSWPHITEVIVIRPDVTSNMLEILLSTSYRKQACQINFSLKYFFKWKCFLSIDNIDYIIITT